MEKNIDKKNILKENEFYIDKAKNPKNYQTTNGKQRFAEGYNFYKIVWIVMIVGFLGDLVETVFVYFTSGIVMDRSSFLYGPFSAVWGIGGGVLTVLLHKLIDKNDRYIFVTGAIGGGIFEVLCSYFTELAFGIVFWDYSQRKFNFYGRTCLLFMVFWGIASVIWIRIIYPYINDFIEKIPVLVGKIITYMFLTYFIINTFFTATAFIRARIRRFDERPAKSKIAIYLDQIYTDEYLQNKFRNMVVKDWFLNEKNKEN